MSAAENYAEYSREQFFSLIDAQQAEILKLQKIIQNANKQLYGRKTEKLSEYQERLALGGVTEEPPASEPETVPINSHERAKRKPRVLPDNLPRERIEYEPDDKNCSHCGTELKRIGEEVSEELECIPTRLFIREHVRFKYACPCCQEGVTNAPLPPEVKPIEGARPGPGLIAHILVSKYQDHLPLTRQESMFARHGIELPKQRLCDWTHGGIALLVPVYEALKAELLATSYIQADETPLKVQDDSTEGLHQGYLWGGCAPPEKIVVFQYFPSRSGECARELFSGFRGTLQTDLYAGYDRLYADGSVVRLGCWAHVRRKFIEVQSMASKECARVLTYIADLYRLESAGKDRAAQAPKILTELRAYLEHLRTTLLPKHAVQDAVQYALSQWADLTRYLEDSRFEIDNNGIERQIRPIAIGRKNWLFAGNHAAAQNSAIIYSLLATSKLNKVNAFEYLSKVFWLISKRGITARQLLPQNIGNVI